jgi:protein-S-isoprenylcysteine O-methyltransferase Ste14
MERPAQSMAFIVYASMVSSVLMLAFVLAVLLGQSPAKASPESFDQPLLMPFGFAALTLAFAAFWVPSLLLKGAVKNVPKQNGQIILSDEQQYRLALNPLLVGLVLAESLALLGFLLGKFSETLAIANPFFAASLLIMFFKFPSSSRVRAQIAKATSFP